MKNNDLQIILDEQKVAKENADSLIKAFGAPFTEAGEILSTYKDIKVTDESQTDLMAQAREKRLTLKRIRTGVETKRKELKASYLATTNAIDGVARYIRTEIEPAEEYLELQERYAEVKRAERAAAIKQDRTQKLMQYTDDISIYNLDTMDQPAFDKLLAELKAANDAKIAQAKADEAEAERLAQERIAEDKRVREENERLKKEAEAAELERQKERKAEAEKQAKIDAEREKELAAERAKAEAERQKREDLEKEQREKDAAAAKAKADQELADKQAAEAAKAAELAELLAPDKDKLVTFSKAIEMIRTQKLPAVKTKQAQDVVNAIDTELTKLRVMIEKAAKEL